MTVPAVGFSGPTFIQLPANGAAMTFSFPFLITAPTDLIVGFITGGVFTQQLAGYTVAGLGNPGGGQITFSVAPPTGTTVDLRSLIPETQPTNFANLGAYLPENTTNALDRGVRNIADLYRLTYQFGIHGPDQEGTPWPALPAAAGRANTGLIFDADGLPALGAIPTVIFTQPVFNAFLQIAFPNTVFTNQSWEPAWGQPDIHVADSTGNNAIIGSILQTTTFTGSNGNFPTGITGYAQMNGAGNTGFGGFFRADLLTTGVAVGAEFDAFNLSGFDANLVFPPVQGFGTTDYVGIANQAVAFGSNKSKVAYQVALGTSTFRCGFYTNPFAVDTYGLFIDSGSAQGPLVPAMIKGMSSIVPLTIQTVGAFNANNGVVQLLDGLTGAVRGATKQDGHHAYSAIQTTVGAAGTASALPAQPYKYVVVEILGDGTPLVFPVYKAS